MGKINYRTPEQKERYLKYQREQYRKNPQRYKERAKAWAQSNKDRRQEILKAYVGRNREQILAKLAEHYQKNRQKIIARSKRWKRNNLTRARESARKTMKKRLAMPGSKLRYSLAGRIWYALKRDIGRKSANTIQLLGCDIDWLMAWLEVQFKPSMSWENYGQGWHIDHVRPCDSFDLTDPAQQKLCFHWTNLQPLWALENWSKGRKWTA